MTPWERLRGKIHPGFHRSDVIKSKCRSRLSIKLANWLMLIAANGPKFGEVDWLAILEIWKSNNARGRYDRAWRLDQTPVANELRTDFDAAAQAANP